VTYFKRLPGSRIDTVAGENNAADYRRLTIRTEPGGDVASGAAWSHLIGAADRQSAEGRVRRPPSLSYDSLRRRAQHVRSIA